MLFEEKHFGKVISEELSKKIRAHTGVDDRFIASAITDVSESLVRQVIFRRAVLTEKNSIAVIEMLRLALENSRKKISTARESIEYFEEQLNLVES